MKDFLDAFGRLCLCVLASTAALAILFLLLIGPGVLAFITQNMWWLLLYIVSIGVLAGVRIWADL